MIKHISILLATLFLLNDKSIIEWEKSARNSNRNSSGMTSIYKSKSIQQELIHKFKSSLNTVENMSGGPVHTNQEISYHTFDYENMKVTMQSYSEVEEKWKNFTYKMKSFYKENQWDYVIECDDKVMKEIWFSPITNEIGYDLHEGTRLTFFQLQKVK
ncbi:MAG: hypothetical protein ABJG78_00440 [Cyclobacteriaceae bacterium]